MGSKEKRIIYLSELDPQFKYEIAKEPGGENIKYCFECNTCTVSCPVAEIDGRYRPRRIIRMILLGMRERVISSDFIWLCASCYSCQERCPQDVKITELMNVLRNMAARSGYLHPSLKKQLEQLEKFGRLYEIEDFDNKRRIRLGLPTLEKRCEEMAEIFKIVGIKNWGKFKK